MFTLLGCRFDLGLIIDSVIVLGIVFDSCFDFALTLHAITAGLCFFLGFFMHMAT